MTKFFMGTVCGLLIATIAITAYAQQATLGPVWISTEPPAVAPTAAPTAAPAVAPTGTPAKSNQKQKVAAAKELLPNVLQGTLGAKLAKLIPAYRNGYAGSFVAAPTELDPAAGEVIVDGFGAAERESDPAIAGVKKEKVSTLVDAFTLNVLQQDVLHIKGYRPLIQDAARELDQHAVEIILAERLSDEAEVEALVNPGFWTTVAWWWEQ